MLVGLYHIDDVKHLRNTTPVGATVRFAIRRCEGYNNGSVGISWADKDRIVEGTIIKKFPFIFMLDNGRTYSWVDLLLGKQLL